MRVREQTILLVSDDAGLREAARREFESREEGLRVAAVSTVVDGCRTPAEVDDNVRIARQFLPFGEERWKWRFSNNLSRDPGYAPRAEFLLR